MTVPSPADATLWLCADLAAMAPEPLVARLRAVLARTPACVWIRPAIDTTVTTIRAVVVPARDAAHAAGGSIVIGDRLDVALALEADGVHLGARSLSPHEARRLLTAHPETPCRFVSGAAHDAHAVRVRARDCDALVVSPFASVPDKGPPLGVGGTAALVAMAPGRRFVALGGILGEEQARAAARAHVHAIAVRRALLDDADPASACARLHDAFVSALDRGGRR
jgi:thiamine-phosphate pyrophosphorylase